MILQTNSARGSTNFIRIMNQVHCIHNQFNLNCQPTSLHVVNNFTIWYLYSQLHIIDFMTHITLFHKEQYNMYKILLITPHYYSSSPKILIDLSYPTAKLDIALQTHSTLYSHDQHFSHNQIHNHITLSSPRDWALLTTMGLCCLLQCTIITYQMRNDVACF